MRIGDLSPKGKRPGAREDAPQSRGMGMFVGLPPQSGHVKISHGRSRGAVFLESKKQSVYDVR